MDRPLISIVLTTFNSEDTIADVLDAIAKQSMPLSKVELIVVDGGSKDQTLELVKSFLEKKGSLFYNVKLIVHDRNYGLSRARNDGIRASSGKYVLILDDDVIMKESILTNLYEFLENSSPKVAAAIPLHVNYPENLLSKWERLIRENRITRASAITSCALIRKEVIDEIGLYDETLGLPFTMGEEIEYYARAKSKGYEVFIMGYEKVLHAIDEKSWKESKSSKSSTFQLQNKSFVKRERLIYLLEKIANAIISLRNPSYRYAYKKYVNSLPLSDKLKWYIYSATTLSTVIFVVLISISNVIHIPAPVVSFLMLIISTAYLTLYIDILREYWNPKVFHISFGFSIIALMWRMLRSIMLVIPPSNTQLCKMLFDYSSRFQTNVIKCIQK